MAQGDVTIFNAFKVTIGKKLVDLSADTIKLGLVTSTYTPTAADADPRWGAGGSTNTSTNEVAPGGNYSAGGPTIGSTTYTASGSTAVFNGSTVTISQNASNPTNARWGIIYDSTDAGKRCIGFLDLGAATNLSNGDLTVNWNASGIAVLS